MLKFVDSQESFFFISVRFSKRYFDIKFNIKFNNAKLEIFILRAKSRFLRRFSLWVWACCDILPYQSERERETETERERDRERERQRDRETERQREWEKNNFVLDSLKS